MNVDTAIAKQQKAALDYIATPSVANYHLLAQANQDLLSATLAGADAIAAQSPLVTRRPPPRRSTSPRWVGVQQQIHAGTNPELTPHLELTVAGQQHPNPTVKITITGQEALDAANAALQAAARGGSALQIVQAAAAGLPPSLGGQGALPPPGLNLGRCTSGRRARLAC